MSGLRFCFLTTFYPPYHFGGDAVAVQRLARGLVQAGHQVDVVHDIDAYRALAPADPPAAPREPAGLEVIGLRSPLGRLSPLLTQQLGRPVANGPRIAALLARGGYDVINYHNVSLLGGPGLLHYGSGIKLYMAHEHWLVCPTHVLWRHQREPCPGRQCLRCQLVYRRPPQFWRWTGVLQRSLAQVDAFIAMSEFSRNKHQEFGFPRDMDVLPPFLPEPSGPDEREAGTRPQQRPYFLFVGRLERLKGLQDILPVFAGPGETDLLVAGDGAFGPDLRAQAAGMTRVRFLGRVAGAELPPLYRHAIALIMPSLGFETFGLSILEAFRQATPVIARRRGPLPEIVEACGGGELFETRDQLVAALERLRDPGYRDLLGQAGQRGLRERWSESVIIPRYLEIVRAAARRRGNARVLERLRGETAA